MEISPTAESFSSPNVIRASSIKPWHLFAVVAFAFFLFATPIGTGITNLLGLSQTKAPTNGTCPTGYVLVNGSCVLQTASGGLPCTGSGASNQLTLSTPLAIHSTLTHVSGGSALGSLVDYRFALATGSNGQPQYQLMSDTGASTDGTAATGNLPFNPAAGWLEEYSAATAYPQWIPVNSGDFGQTLQLGSGATYTFGCYSSAASLFNWNGIASIIEAPATGTSNSAGVKLIVTSSSGALLGTTVAASQSVLPTSAIRWDILTEVFTPYAGAIEPTTVYGTANAPVTNYGSLTNPSGGIVTTSGAVQLGAYITIFTNRTGISITLDPMAATSDPNAQIISPNTGLNTAATKEWIIGPLKGCSPSGGGASTTNPYYCNDLPIDIAETASQGTAHSDINFQLRDMTQGGWLAQNAYIAAAVAAGFPVAGAAYGAVTNLYSIIGVTGNNAGNPAPLIEQSYTTINIY